MFDEIFCVALSFFISEALSKSDDKDWRRCWCDGVLLPDNNTDDSVKQLIRTREVVTKAWIDEGQVKGGQRGQFLYDMILYFGEASLDKLKTGDRLDGCIPEDGADSWIVLNRERKTIEIQLM